MSERVRETRPRVLLRIAGITAAFALTIGAVWMIALGHTQRQVSLGVILGLWAALVGAMTFYGGRSTSSASTSNSVGSGNDVELRQDFALELQREVSARRAYEQQLHDMVRREIETIQRVVGDQLGRLRDDVASLRSDLVDQVGGKIRLERIETTRVIGSDIEALQNEVRQLAGNRISDSMNKPVEPRRVVDSDRADDDLLRTGVANGAHGLAGSIRAADDNGREAEAPTPAYQPYVAPTYAPAVTYSANSEPAYSAPPESIQPPPAQPEPQPVAAPSGFTLPPLPPIAPLPAMPPLPPLPPIAPLPSFGQSSPSILPLDSQPVAAQPYSAQLYQAQLYQAQPYSAPQPYATQPYSAQPYSPASNGSAPTFTDDPFAGLPRLSQYNEPDPVPVAPAPAWSPQFGPSWSASATPGTRRHGAVEDDEPPASPPPAGGRRRRADGETNEVLARLLGNP